MRAHGGFAGDGQQLAVTPHGLGARLDQLARERLLDALVIVGHFEGAEIEFADVGGGERIFPAAFAALEGLHVTVSVFVTHIIFQGGGSIERCHSDFGGGGLMMTPGRRSSVRPIRGNKNAPTRHDEKGPQNGCAASHFSQANGA